MSEQASVVVTGAAGFIGQHLVARLRAEDIGVVGYDARTRSATGWDACKEAGAKMVLGDVVDGPTFNRMLSWANPAVVYHLAAESHVCASLEAPSASFRTNAEGTNAVALACAKRGIPLLYVSTDEVYGDVVGIAPRVETSPLYPSSPYSAGKAAGEMAVHAVARSFGLVAGIVRPSNAWGPGQYPEKLVPIACRLLQQGRPVPLHGGGEQVRQWIQVNELADGIYRAGWRLIGRSGNEVEVHNLAGAVLATVRQVVERIALVAGVDPAGATQVVPDRPGQDLRYDASGWRAFTSLGFCPERSILDERELQALLAAYPPNGEVKLARYEGVNPRS